MAAVYLLDTNLLVHLMRGKAIGLAIENHFRLRGTLNRCVISVVTVGEIFSLARRWKWGATRQADLQKLLSQLVWVDINQPAILTTYGELDNLSFRAGRMMNKNDLWIAATAKVSGVTLLTTDGDIDHLHPIHLNRIRIDESTGNPLP